MKTLRFTLVIAAATLFAFAGAAVAAESITWSISEFRTVSGKSWKRVTADVVTAADGSLTTTLLGGADGGAGTRYDLRGHFLYYVYVAPGATPPTASSDLYLPQDSASGVDILGGAGVNNVTTAAAAFQPVINSDSAAVPVYGPLYLKVINNAVNSAAFTVVMHFFE